MYQPSDYRRPVDEADDLQGKSWRPSFKRDYGRVIHSASFRRLQGKTQLFPGRESDFFRNRLTHSLEVAQIAEGIADRLNEVYADELASKTIDGRLVATAGLIHDIGHPPFGHNGERALDEKMKEHGGFEGNAQTLRILSRLEKKVRYADPVQADYRAGLNLCFRTLASVLKYDEEIPIKRRKKDGFVKGYYSSEAPIVSRIKEAVLAGATPPARGEFKTVECGIMDLADDIAYSVYDLEDSLKVGISTPASILASDDDLLAKVASEVSRKCKKKCRPKDVLSQFVDIFRGILSSPYDVDHPDYQVENDPLVLFNATYRFSSELASDAYNRTRLSSQLVHEFINGVKLDLNPSCLALSKVSLEDGMRMKVEILKQYTYISIISSYQVKLTEFMGIQIVKDIFDDLSDKKGYLLMPDDVGGRYLDTNDKSEKKRIICDFVAGMTDRYAMEFWARLRSDAAESMFKPI
jgi:dGTPase